MKGTLSQQLLQKGITWDQLGLKQDGTPSSESKLLQSLGVPTFQAGKDANIKESQDISKENKNKIHSYGKETASSVSQHGYKYQSQLSNLVHSKTAVTPEIGNHQAKQQQIQTALITPKSHKENPKVANNTISTIENEILSSTIQSSEHHRKDLGSDLNPKKQHHQANIQIITDYTESNNPNTFSNDYLHSFESNRLTSQQSELKLQYYNNNSNKHSESTSINPTQIFSSSPKAQSSVERRDTIAEITTDFSASGNSSSQKINFSNINQSDRRFFLQLPKSAALDNQLASSNFSDTPQAKSEMITHQNHSKIIKIIPQSSPSKSSQAKDHDASNKERISSFQQTRANTAHNTPQSINKNTQIVQQTNQEFSSYSSTNSSTKSQILKNIEKTTPIHKNNSSISSSAIQQITHSHQRSLLNSYPFSVQVNHSQNKSISAVEQLKQQHTPNSHDQKTHTYSALHQQQRHQQHSTDLNSLQYEQFQRRSATQTQFTFPTQTSQSSLQMLSIDSPHQEHYFSVSSLNFNQLNHNSHQKHTGYSHKQQDIPHRDTEFITSTSKTTTNNNTTTPSQIFNHNSISKLTQFAPHSHQHSNILQWKYDIPSNIYAYSNTPVSAHNNSVSAKKPQNQVGSPELFMKKKMYNKSCMNLNAKQLMTRTETAQTLEDFDDYESVEKSQKLHNSNRINGNNLHMNSQNNPMQAQQNAYINLESPSSSEVSESSKKRGSYSNESLLSPPKNSKENQQQFEKILAALQTSQNPGLLSELTGLYSSIFNLQEGKQNYPVEINEIKVVTKPDNSSRMEDNLQIRSNIDQQSIIQTCDTINSLEANQDVQSSAPKFNKENNIDPKLNNTPKCCPPSLDEQNAIKLAGIQDNTQQDEEEKEREEFLREEERVALQQSTLLSQYIDFSKEEFIKLTRDFYTHKNNPIPEHNSLKEQYCTISELLELQKWMTEHLVDRLDEEKKARLKTEEQTSLMLLNQEKTIKVMENKWNNQLEQLQRTKTLSASGKNAENQLLTMHSGTLPTFNFQS